MVKAYKPEQQILIKCRNLFVEVPCELGTEQAV